MNCVLPKRFDGDAKMNKLATPELPKAGAPEETVQYLFPGL